VDEDAAAGVDATTEGAIGELDDAAVGCDAFAMGSDGDVVSFAAIFRRRRFRRENKNFLAKIPIFAAPQLREAIRHKFI
jgi:hypothetical protein